MTPQNWLYLGSYKSLRIRLLESFAWESVIRLGPHAFETIGGEVVNVALTVISRATPAEGHNFAGIDASSMYSPNDKAAALSLAPIVRVNQAGQLRNPDAKIIVGWVDQMLPELSNFADSYQGLMFKDRARQIRFFFELDFIAESWHFLQSSSQESAFYRGIELILNWEDFEANYSELGGNYKWNSSWGQRGVAVSRMGALPRSLYSGHRFDGNVDMIIPKEPEHLTAIWSYVDSPEYITALRTLDPKLGVTTASLVQVPFDLARWQEVAAAKYPDGLPRPHSDDPTQWLFSGHPKGSEQPLHVAVARLLGYRWPRQTGSSFPDCPALGSDHLEGFTDEDGLVCLPPLNREQPAAERLRRLLFEALGAFDERVLITSTGIKGSKSKTLEDWLRDEFFEQHAKLFRDRPFIWHLWDGRSDGFHVLVNYHRLDHANLQKLTYSYLGSWIQQQSDDARADKPGAADRLGAARVLQAKLTAILEGESPLDIFVRWKPIRDQARGWHPDINDGIRQNIRPFLLAGDVGRRGAGLFRTVPLALKDKDRGNEPERPKGDYPWYWCEAEPGTDPVGGRELVGSRWNNCHLTLSHKQRAST